MSSGYELHQKLRTKTVRLVKKKQYDEAISTLHTGALSLLSTNEQGSACDLATYMIDVYGIKNQPVDSESRDRITDIVDKTAPDFWRKKVVDAAVKWSIKATGASTGDPLLRLAVAKVYARDGQYELAEGHFLASCLVSEQTYTVESAPKAYATAMATWLTKFATQASEQEGETRGVDAIQRIEAGRFALRATIPLLANHAVQPAITFQEVYITTITSSLKNLLLPVKPNPRPYTPPGKPSPNPSSNPVALYLTANADLNFSQMAVALVSESAKLGSDAVPDWLRNAWVSLVRQYEREAGTGVMAEDETVRGAIPRIGADWFGLRPQRSQGNPLSEMMASLFAPQDAKPKPAPTAQIQSPPTQPPSTRPDDLVDDEMD